MEIEIDGLLLSKDTMVDGANVINCMAEHTLFKNHIAPLRVKIKACSFKQRNSKRGLKNVCNLCQNNFTSLYTIGLLRSLVCYST